MKRKRVKEGRREKNVDNHNKIPLLSSKYFSIEFSFLIIDIGTSFLRI